LDSISILNKILCAVNNSVEDMSLINSKILKSIEKVLEENRKEVSLVILIPLLNNIDFKYLETNVEKIGSLSNRLLDVAINTKDSFINKYVSIVFSILLNSIENLESNKFDINVNSLEAKLLSVPYDNNLSILNAYITKALVTRGYKNIEPWLQVLVEHIKKYETGKHMIESLKIIIKQDSFKEDHYGYKNVRFLYRQRLFMFTLKKILKNIATINENAKEDKVNTESKITKLNNYLAILIQLKHLPSQIILSHIKTLLPIMIECLSLISETQLGTNIGNHTSSEIEFPTSLSDELIIYYDAINFDEALENLLNLFMEFLKTKVEILQEYVNSYVEKFLCLARFHSSLNHRISALQCLYYLSYFDVIRLVPFKNQVLEGLKHCLDDRKRLVRKQAVATIDRWYILDSIKDED
jgi:hypothetical protein